MVVPRVVDLPKLVIRWMGCEVSVRGVVVLVVVRLAVVSQLEVVVVLVVVWRLMVRSCLSWRMKMTMMRMIVDWLLASVPVQLLVQHQ